jgi:membrane-associated PAP2 superfamily phosphatase
MLACGPGLLINSILKPHCHRPRPNQIAQFGGTHQFVSVLTLGTPADGKAFKSFPSGHASMGFLLMAPAFVVRQHSPKGARLFLLLGLTAGVVLGLTRIAQGRHFPSDVLWSGGLVYFTAVGLYYAMGLHRPVMSPHARSGHPTATVPTRRWYRAGSGEGWGRETESGAQHGRRLGKAA